MECLKLQDLFNLVVNIDAYLKAQEEQR